MLEALKRGIMDGKRVIRIRSGSVGRFDNTQKEIRLNGGDISFFYTTGTMLGELIGSMPLMNFEEFTDVLIEIDHEGQPKIKQ